MVVAKPFGLATIHPSFSARYQLVRWCWQVTQRRVANGSTFDSTSSEFSQYRPRAMAGWFKMISFLCNLEVRNNTIKFFIHITPSSAGDAAPQWSKGVGLSSTIANCVGPNPTGVMLWDYHAALCSNSEPEDPPEALRPPQALYQIIQPRHLAYRESLEDKSKEMKGRGTNERNSCK